MTATRIGVCLPSAFNENLDLKQKLLGQRRNQQGCGSDHTFDQHISVDTQPYFAG